MHPSPSSTGLRDLAPDFVTHVRTPSPVFSLSGFFAQERGHGTTAIAWTVDRVQGTALPIDTFQKLRPLEGGGWSHSNPLSLFHRPHGPLPSTLLSLSSLATHTVTSDAPCLFVAMDGMVLCQHADINTFLARGQFPATPYRRSGPVATLHMPAFSSAHDALRLSAQALDIFGALRFLRPRLDSLLAGMGLALAPPTHAAMRARQL